MKLEPWVMESPYGPLQLLDCSFDGPRRSLAVTLSVEGQHYGGELHLLSQSGPGSRGIEEEEVGSMQRC